MLKKINLLCLLCIIFIIVVSCESKTQITQNEDNLTIKQSVNSVQCHNLIFDNLTNSDISETYIYQGLLSENKIQAILDTCIISLKKDTNLQFDSESVRNKIISFYEDYYIQIDNNSYLDANILNWDYSDNILPPNVLELLPIINSYKNKDSISDILADINNLHQNTNYPELNAAFFDVFYSEYNGNPNPSYYGMGSSLADSFGIIIGGAAGGGAGWITGPIVGAAASYVYDYFYPEAM